MKYPRVQADHLLDAVGQMLQVGDKATLVYIDRLYLYGLPTERQELYEAQLERTVTISDRDDCGNVAIAVTDEAGVRQQFWIEPRWLRRLPI